MLVNSDQKDIPLRVVNVGNKPILLQEEMKVATCETVTDADSPIPSVSTIHDDSEAVAIDDHNISSKIPSHLTKLYEDCIGSLTLKQQSKVADLLVNVQHIFAHDKNDIGKTSMIKHRINTKDTQPIKQPASSLPPAKREECNLEVQRMLNQGIIEPSQSPWSSPIVLVRKKDGQPDFVLTIVASIMSHLRTPTNYHGSMIPWMP